MFSVENLERGIEHARKNIRVLEDAIERERQTIKEYRIMIDDIEFAEKQKKAAEEGISIEVVNDNPN